MARKKTDVKEKNSAPVTDSKGKARRKSGGKERLKPRVLVLGHVQSAIEAAGGSAVWLQNTDERAAKAIRLGTVDGLLLTGGGDVNPLLYAEKRDPRCYGINYKRDTVEWDAITAADEMKIPVLGICRGSQIINVVYGGTLHQHIQALPHTHEYHNGGDHRVKATEGSRLGMAWGKTDEERTRWVISIHHQAVDQVAEGFVATGWGLDGTIEAIEMIERWVVGVQFHPEMATSDPEMQRIFDAFVAACAKNAGLTFTPKSHPDRASKPTGGSGTHWLGGFRREGSKKMSPLPLKSGDLLTADTADTLDLNTSIGVPSRKKRAAAGEPVLTKWRCFRCEIDFEERVDHTDHMMFLHGIAVDE